MNREQAEQQAKCWSWWTGEKTRSGPYTRDLWVWHIKSRNGWVDGPDLSGPGSPHLRRAIEAKATYISLDSYGKEWHAFIDNGEHYHMGSGDSLEAALYAAALAASEGSA